MAEDVAAQLQRNLARPHVLELHQGSAAVTAVVTVLVDHLVLEERWRTDVHIAAPLGCSVGLLTTYLPELEGPSSTHREPEVEERGPAVHVALVAATAGAHHLDHDIFEEPLCGRRAQQELRILVALRDGAV